MCLLSSQISKLHPGSGTTSCSSAITSCQTQSIYYLSTVSILFLFIFFKPLNCVNRILCFLCFVSRHSRLWPRRIGRMRRTRPEGNLTLPTHRRSRSTRSSSRSWSYSQVRSHCSPRLYIGKGTYLLLQESMNGLT